MPMEKKEKTQTKFNDDTLSMVFLYFPMVLSMVMHIIFMSILILPKVFTGNSGSFWFALLSGTLRTFQVHACDGEELKLECPNNTVISIYLAQYGRNVPSHQLCPSSSPSSHHNIISNSSSSLSITSAHNMTSLLNNSDTTDCLASDSLRYSLLQTVESSCREQRICKFMTSPQSFGGIDPCPGVRKYAEVAYKCRPNTFLNKVICGGDRFRLKCQGSSRIVIYSATFGSTLLGVPECPQLVPTDGNVESITSSMPSEECQVSYATETVMSSCHGRKKCSLSADTGTFGDPGCSKTVRLHLKIVYTCVPRDVLKELDLGDNDEKSNTLDTQMGGSVEDNSETGDYTGFVEEPRYVPDIESPLYVSSTPLSSSGHIGESYIKVTSLKKGDLITQTTKNPLIKKDLKSINTIISSDNSTLIDSSNVNCTIIEPRVRVIGFISEWISAVNYIKRNTERFILYLLVSVCGSLVCFLIVLSSRLYIQKRRAVKKVREDITCTPFGALSGDNTDDLLDQLDGVTTVTEPLNHNRGHNQQRSQHHHHTIEVVRYGTRNTNNDANGNRSSTLRRQGSDTNPRSLSRNLNNYYYS